jgi:hypothetical protein
MSLKFEPQNHTYKWNGHPCPSHTALSDIVHGVQYYPDNEKTRAARKKGDDFHEATELFENAPKGKMLERGNPTIERWIETYEKFLISHFGEPPKWTHIEAPLHSITGYCTTIDRGILSQKRAFYLDLKTGAKDEVKHRFQLAAGLIALVEQVPIEEKILGIEMRGLNFYLRGESDETWDYQECRFSLSEIIEYQKVLSNAVGIWKYRRKHGVEVKG